MRWGRNSRVSSKVIIALIFHLSFFIAKGQRLNTRNFDPRSGLSSSEAYYAIQDKQGFIWIATDAGVNRFDGREFRTFTTEDGLADNTVFNIYEDHRGRIWFLSYSGAISYFQNGSIHNIAANDTLRKLIRYRNEVIVSFHVDAGDTLWVSYNSKISYIRIAPHSDFGTVAMIPGGPAERNITFTGDGNNAVYTAVLKFTPTGNLRISHDNKVREIDLHDGNNSTVPAYVRFLHRGPDDIFLSVYNVLYHITSAEVRMRTFKSRIVALSLDHSGNLWTGVYQHGVYRFPQTEIIQQPQQFFQGLTVTHVLEDHERGFWFTTLEKGVFYAPSLHMQHLDFPGGEQSVLNMVSDSKHLFAGTATGLVHCVADTADRPVGKFSFSTNNRRVNAMYMLEDKLFTNTDGLAIFSKQGKSLGLFSKETFFIAQPETWVPASESIVASSLYEVLYCQPDGTVQHRDTLPVRINCLAHAPDSSLLIGCKNGLWQKKNGVMSNIGHLTSAISYPIVAMLTDSRRRLWISTKGGGIAVLENGVFSTLTHDNNVLSKNCGKMAEDQSGRIWIASAEGLYVIDQAGKNVSRIGMEQGLRTNEIISVHCFGNNLFVGTPLGLEFFPLDRDVRNMTPPPVFINGILVDDEARDAQSLHSLPFDSNDIEFAFIGLTYKAQQKRQYKYRLAGYDAGWRYTSNENVKYTNLPAGKYVFEVYAVNSSGVESAQPARQNFTILLPWWQESWAIISAFTLGACILILGTFLFVRRVKRRQEKKARIEQLLVESRLTALRAQMNPHFIFNVINSIQHFILISNKEKAYDYLARFSRLIRMVLDNSRYTTITLDKEIQLLTLYVDLEKMRFEQDLEFRIEVRTDLPADNLSLPNMLIQPYVENAIIHGIAPRKSPGILELCFEQRGSNLRAVIRDNGIGRKRSTEVRRSTHRPAGMTITAERLKIIGESVKSDIRITVNDLQDAYGEPAGTEVELNIPLM